MPVSALPVRLIACDMDGTLLNSRKEIHPDMTRLIHALHQKGIRFVAASGRQLESLTGYFAGVENEMTFLAENGGAAYENGVCIDASLLGAEDILSITRFCREMPGVRILCSTTRGSYIEGEEQTPWREYLAQFFEKIGFLPDLCALIGREDICKITLCDRGRAEKNAWPRLNKALGDRFQVTLSGEDWVDITGRGVSKGQTLRRLQQRYGILPGECAAFGDYLNDVELLQSCGESYAMKNAHPLLLKAARHVTREDNDHWGAFDEICRLTGIDPASL